MHSFEMKEKLYKNFLCLKLLISEDLFTITQFHKV